ncbi:hypothetical protein [Streptomyces rishiriensis]|uniref:hypothetical protein n=1 Tax=Streptomyces rishiriensis TaxID=68264 RepID=UPI00131EEB05|nr:hypothetical protein [Streptomyces rishiriensis]
MASDALAAVVAFSSCSRSIRMAVAGEGCWPFFVPVVRAMASMSSSVTRQRR